MVAEVIPSARSAPPYFNVNPSEAAAALRSVDWHALQSSVSQQLLRSVNQRSERQLRLMAAGLVGALAAIYYFRRDIKQSVSEEAAELGALTMSHESVRAEVQSIGRFLAHEILHDPSVSAAATTLVADVIRRESTKAAFLDLVLWTLERDATRTLVRDQLRAVVADLCADDLVAASVSRLLGDAIS